MISTKSNKYFIWAMLIAIVISVGITYYRYIVLQDFIFFTTNNQIPDRFSISSYENL